ncbi:hypothetical protein G7Z17_g5051 [Cylindrodendrum hubeiense]|uniref:Knr4/Smi1-like domain-containing protein n=1 Tax=Cylindrodendrum hubeiense TaxID=595255 RepID=A0A9P5H7I1_9HYPO|nr:hypothetical protein G7Z17_g5051 [Cylindrodendrum hubeiense]
MASFKKFDADAILTDPDLGYVYRSMHELAKEFAVLGQIETAKTLISLLLSQYSSEWQLRQIRPLKFAFAEADQWPDEIPLEERTETELAKIVEAITPDFENESDAVDDPSELGVLFMTADGCDDSTGGEARGRSKALVDALALATRLVSKHTPPIEEIEADPNVQKALGLISTRMHANHAIEYLIQRRDIWGLLATGALARKIPVDMDKLEALGKEAIESFTERVKKGRKTHVTEKKSIRELLEALDRNTRTNTRGQYEEMGENVPESLFVLPPATDEQISALECKLDVSLPDDYKEFLTISNGFGRTWNGYHLDSPIFGVDELDWGELYVDDLPVELHETIAGFMDLELSDGREWPSHEKPILLGSYDIFQTWFITPSVTKKTLEAYKQVIESPETPDDVKRHTDNLIVSRYGSWKAFERLEWVVIEMDEGENEAFGTFTQFLQARVRKVAIGVWEGEAEREAGSISYSCRDDQPKPDRIKRRKVEE